MPSSSIYPRPSRVKLRWRGIITGIQPRIRLMRSFDERSHSYLGYALHLFGTVDGVERDFSVGIGKGAQEKFLFQAGDQVSGNAVPVMDERLEPVELYKASALVLHERAPEPPAEVTSGPPWHGPPPQLEIYRQRGHRRLDPRTYDNKCTTCKWGCCMPVEIVPDNWNPVVTKYRFETFCYGPKSCSRYRAGATRKAPGRGGIIWEEEDWVDEDATAHRGPDE